MMDPDDDVSLPPSASSFADEGPSDLLSVLNMAASLDGASESGSVELPPSVCSSMPGSAMSVVSFVSLPPDCPETDDYSEDEAGLAFPAGGETVCADVPSPASFLPFFKASRNEFVAEYSSPPRVLPKCRVEAPGAAGNFNISLDVLNGWDFSLAANRHFSLRFLQELEIRWLILSPPCTVFSELQRLFNIKKMRKEQWEAKFAKGMVFLDHSMNCAWAQLRRGNKFIFEHPARASSWQQPSVQALRSRGDVYTADFDLCMLGLVSKVHRVPQRKRTRIMTNCRATAESFLQYQCCSNHEHQEIIGSEGGVRRSTWAQVYPGPMVAHLCRCVLNH